MLKQVNGYISENNAESDVDVKVLGTKIYNKRTYMYVLGFVNYDSSLKNPTVGITLDFDKGENLRQNGTCCL